MVNLRELSYKIIGLSTADVETVKKLKDEFSTAKGVIGVEVDCKTETVKYALDQWASDYDVFTNLNEICEKLGLELDFGEDITNLNAEETSSVIQDESGKTVVKEGDEFESEPEIKKGKLQKSDIIEKIVVFALAIAVTVIGSLIKNQNVKPWALMIGFTLASYETLYAVIIKIAEKKYFFEEIITFVGALILTYLGYTTSAFAIMLIYGILCFVQSIITHKTVSYEEKLDADLANASTDEEKLHASRKIEFLKSVEDAQDTKTANIELNKFKFNLIDVIVALALTFIPPLFKIKTYGVELTSKWLFVGATTLALSCFGSVLYSLSLTAKLSVMKCLKEGVYINDYNAFVKLASIKGVCLDESVIYEDAYGAVTEIKEDIGLNVSVVSGESAETVTNLKKELGATGGLAKAGNHSKAKFANNNCQAIVSKQDFSTVCDNSIAYGKEGKITVDGDELKKVPFVIKMARRVINVYKMNKVLPILVKAFLIAVLVVTKVVLGIDAIWWIFALDFIANIGYILNALRNYGDAV